MLKDDRSVAGVENETVKFLLKSTILPAGSLDRTISAVVFETGISLGAA